MINTNTESNVPFSESETKINLMRAFAGESQARNRYWFAAECAKNNKQYVINAVFKFTAEQELAHAKVFYDYLKDFSGSNIKIDAAYPTDNYDNIGKHLEAAVHNELEEYNDVYKSFGDTARKEGFMQIASAFSNIADIEKVHAERFKLLADLLNENKLFVSDVSARWMCLNCGYIYSGTSVPDRCPVCSHERGYFIRVELAPYTGFDIIK